MAPMPGRVFRRSTQPDPPVAVSATGSTIRDAEGRAYLDAAGGAIVVNVGHGRQEIAAAMADQAGRLAYAHGSAFTTEPVEAYAAEIGDILPIDDPAIYPVSGGSEAIETALKLARAYHLARGDAERWTVIARWGSYHGNTLGALDLSGRPSLRRPYESWLGRFRHISAAYPYRDGYPGAHALASGVELAEELDRQIQAAGPDTVAAFVAEPIVGAALGAVVPPDDYWPAILDVCRRHGVLVIADEVMTGFGRTGRWFGADHWGIRPDILVAAKGATSGYWPFGFAAASGEVYARVTAPGAGFTHGFTYSHAPVGAAVARQVLRILRDEDLVTASATKGERLRAELATRLGEHPAVGEIRGRGLMVGIELVEDREDRRPFARGDRVTEAVVAAARERGVLVYSGTGNANGTDGDTILLGPPFVVTDDELSRIVDVVATSIETAVQAAMAGEGAIGAGAARNR
jgi:adenosylmethionine-8-amino-7-oxononanoate aminotransferase